jgi:cytochrome c biogenesis protein CcmG/thiol:disulfide interchange protein DsbE
MRGRVALVSSIAIAVVLGALVLVLSGAKPSTTRAADSPLLGKVSPPLAGDTLVAGDGDAEGYDLVDKAGTWVLVNFFATWCVPCQAEHDDLIAFSNAHASAGDASLVSVVFDDEPDAVRAYFRKRGGDWPVVNDEDGKIATDFGVTGVPESYLIDPNGIVRAKIVGGVEADKLEKLLADAKAG